MLEDLSHLSLHLSDDALLDLFNQYNGELCGAPHMVQEYLTAFEYFCKIARKENDFGYEFYALGRMYELGQGVAQDRKKARGFTQKRSSTTKPTKRVDSETSTPRPCKTWNNGFKYPSQSPNLNPHRCGAWDVW